MIHTEEKGCRRLKKDVALNNIVKCSNCGLRQFEIINSRHSGETAIRRRRRCVNCGQRITTYEISAEDYEMLLLVVTARKGGVD